MGDRLIGAAATASQSTIHQPHTLIFVGGRFNLATAVGYHAVAASAYDLSLSFTFGDGSLASAASEPGKKMRIGNIAMAFAPGQRNAAAYSSGVGSLALNLFGGYSAAAAFGRGNTAVVAGTYNSWSYAAGTLVSATTVLGRNTVVNAGPGPLAIAGSILQQNVTVTKAGPGLNINGVTLGGKKTAAVHTKGSTSGTGHGRKR